MDLADVARRVEAARAALPAPPPGSFTPHMMQHPMHLAHQHQQQQQQQPQPHPSQQVFHVPPPPDHSVQQTIERMAHFVVKNGADFEALVKQKEVNNSAFSFLWPTGRHHDYYQWVMHCVRTGTPVQAPPAPLPPQQQPPVPPQLPHQSPHMAPQQQQQVADLDLSPDEQAVLYAKLADLNASQKAITGFKEWTLTLLPEKGAAIAVRLRKHVQSVQQSQVPKTAYSAALCVIYVINDILVSGRCPGSFDAQCLAQLPSMLRAGSTLAATQAEVDKLARVCRLWGGEGAKKKVFSDADIAQLIAAVTDKATPLQQAPASPVLQSAAAPPSTQQHQQQQPPPMLQLPPQPPGAATGGWPPQPPQPPQQQPPVPHPPQQQPQQFSHAPLPPHLMAQQPQQQQQYPQHMQQYHQQQQQQHMQQQSMPQQLYSGSPQPPQPLHVQQHQQHILQQPVPLPPHLAYLQQAMHPQQQQQQQQFAASPHLPYPPAPAGGGPPPHLAMLMQQLQQQQHSSATPPQPSPSPPSLLQAAFPVAAGAAPHGQDLDSMPVGMAVGLVKAALRGGSRAYAPIDVSLLPPTKPPHIEPGRLEVRLTDFYKRLSLEDDRRERALEREEKRREAEAEHDRRAKRNSTRDAAPRDRHQRDRDRDSDRSRDRRSDAPMPKSEPDTVIAEDNVGYQALKKMGWQEGAGLGASGSGIAEPVKSGGQLDRGGVGARVADADVDAFEAFRRAKSYSSRQN